MASTRKKDKSDSLPVRRKRNKNDEEEKKEKEKASDVEVNLPERFALFLPRI